MAIQRINFTNRRRLTREHANILIHPATDPRSASTFEALLDLTPLRPAADAARVFVEAYHQTTRMRFDFGTVGIPTPPPPTRCTLDEFPDWRDVRFRVKITDVTDNPGRIVAWADRIKPKGPDDRDESDLVRFKDADLYGLLWDLDYDEQGPIVMIERNAGGVQNVGRDDRFRAAVFPEVLRRALAQAIIVEKAVCDDPGHWFKRWYDGYLHPKLGLQPPPEDPATWIEDAVRSFANRFRIADFWTAASATQETSR